MSLAWVLGETLMKRNFSACTSQSTNRLIALLTRKLTGTFCSRAIASNLVSEPVSILTVRFTVAYRAVFVTARAFACFRIEGSAWYGRFRQRLDLVNCEVRALADSHKTFLVTALVTPTS